jgi:tetratricopeptide (TPR) repeat protein
MLDGKILNMDAQLAYARKEYEAAGEAASRGLAANRARGDRDEVANSLRLLGGSFLETNFPEKADASVREALEIDKDLALPQRILRDLILLGRAAQARGDAAQARAYLARALGVASAIRDERSVAEVSRLAAALPN